MKVNGRIEEQTILKDLGQRLAWQRRQYKLTQAALAEAAGISKRTVERMESGYSIQVATLLKILRVFHLLGGLDQLIPPIPKNPPRLKSENGDSTKSRGKHLVKKSLSWGADS